MALLRLPEHKLLKVQNESAAKFRLTNPQTVDGSDDLITICFDFIFVVGLL